jgi:mRNA interferase MazF
MKRGDLFWADLTHRKGSEQQGKRPVLVLSHDAFNAIPNWRSVIVVPLTTSPKAMKGPTAVPVPKRAGGLPADSIALCHQVTTLDRARLRERVGALSPESMRAVEHGLLTALGFAI